MLRRRRTWHDNCQRASRPSKRRYVECFPTPAALPGSSPTPRISPRSITHEHQRALALDSVAGALAAADPNGAERIAQSITSDHGKGMVLHTAAGVLAATDPRRAERIAQSITSESAKASALAIVAKALAVTSL